MIRRENIQQHTPEWLAYRRERIMASDAPIIMRGSHFGKTKYHLWEEKLGLREKSEENSAMAYGNRMESVARQAYEKVAQVMMTPAVISHADIHYLGASLDGLSLENDLAVEIKCCGIVDHNSAKQGTVPEKYYPQLQHQLACLGHDLMHYFSYCREEGVIVEVRRDPTYIQQMYCLEEEFWECMMNMSPPKLIQEDFHAVQDPEWKDLGVQLRDVETKLKEMQDLKDLLRDRMLRIADGKNCEGAGIKIEHYYRQGAVDYKKIPELKGLDLEPYRKESTRCSRFSFS